MPYMYILECSDGTFYTGSTWHLSQRLDEHNAGMGANYTSKRLPVKMIYFEEFSRIDDAFKREKQVQNWSHIKKKALIDGAFDKIHKLAICRNETRSPSVAEEPIKE
jgi:putative endonuclease